MTLTPTLTHTHTKKKSLKVLIILSIWNYSQMKIEDNFKNYKYFSFYAFKKKKIYQH